MGDFKKKKKRFDMKIKLWSDLHLEFREHLFDHIFDPIYETDESNKDTILLLAGDIDVGVACHEFINEMCKHFKHVLYVCGNHEFYGFNFDSVITMWREFEEAGPDNFHFLHNDYRILDGVRFIGGTMWTSLDNGNPLIARAAHRTMSDYHSIFVNSEQMKTSYTIAEHEKFVKFITKAFDDPFAGKTVVMTHHSPGSVYRSGYGASSINHAYFADLEMFIGNSNKASLWVHGHTHMSADYMINETRIVCNPYGYWGQEVNKRFNPKLILEV